MVNRSTIYDLFETSTGGAFNRRTLVSIDNYTIVAQSHTSEGWTLGNQRQ